MDNGRGSEVYTSIHLTGSAQVERFSRNPIVTFSLETFLRIYLINHVQWIPGHSEIKIHAIEDDHALFAISNAASPTVETMSFKDLKKDIIKHRWQRGNNYVQDLSR